MAFILRFFKIILFFCLLTFVKKYSLYVQNGPSTKTFTDLALSVWPSICCKRTRRLPTKSPKIWIWFLLILCCDIELNPGPVTIDDCPQGHLKIVSANVNSLTSKLDEIRLLLSTHKVDALLLQETKLDSNIDSKELFVPGYHLERKDRNRSGGGVAIYARVELKPTRLTRCFDIEALAVNCY